MRYLVKVMPRAARQVDDLARWWQENRLEAPSLVRDEIMTLIVSLQVHPARGILVAVGRDRRRMVVTPRTRLLILYRIRPRAGRVEIIEVRRP